MMVVQAPKPNVKQQECINNIDGKYLVLAGPGTGKTFTIINRIKYMLEKNINPEKILCLTFTDAAANEMKTRLENSLQELSTGVNVYTYHGFCCEILETYPEEFELPVNFKIISDSVSRAFVKECIEEINSSIFRTEKNDPYFYIQTIKNRIEEIKKNRLTKEQYFKNIELNSDWKPHLFELKDKLEEKNRKGDKRIITLVKDIEKMGDKINQAEELWKFYESYQNKMIQNRYLDFNDMIALVLDKFENDPAFLETVANQYEYILVDEYQDTNKSQNSIVFNLTHALRSENVFVVGDDDQIIYTFQGAKLDTIERFLDEFPETKVVCLEENMRSTQTILDVARNIIMQDPSRLEDNVRFKDYNISKKLVAKNEKIMQLDKPVRCYRYVDKMQEYNHIVEEVEELIKSEDCPKDIEGNKKLSEIAILAKTNAELDEFAEMFKVRNVPYELKKGLNIFKIHAVNVLYFYLQMLVNPEMHAFRIFELLLSHPFDINAKDFQRLYDESSKTKTFIDLIRKIPEKEFVEYNKILDFIKTYDYLREFKMNESIKNTILEVGAKTGIFDYYINSDTNRTENIAGLKKFIEEATSYSEVYRTSLLEDFMNYLEIMLIDDIPILTDKAPVDMNAVQLSTYYASKGREFEYVYMPTLNSEKWEKDRDKSVDIPLNKEEYKTKEERAELKISDRAKVLYVGMTRAKQTLRLSYVQTINGKVKNISNFIANIQDSLEQKSLEEYTENSYWYEAKKALIKRDYDYKKEFRDMVDNVLRDRSFSPTSVNSYLRCPRQYLYNYVLDFNGKDGNPDALSFGTSIHAACEFAVNYAMEHGEYPAKDLFIQKFKDELSKLPLSSYEQRTNIEGRGENALSKYYVQLISTPISWLYGAERKIDFDLDGIKFYGIIDRIDKNDDGTYNIYDYKTGSAKNSRVICQGGDHEDYYNQMGLYKYFFEKSTGNTVKSTMFIFPEDFTKNLVVEYESEDCDEIVEKFKQAIQGIRNYEFEPSYQKEACEYCAYRDFCAMERI